MAPWYAEGAIQDPGLRADASIFNMKSAAKCSPKSRVREKRSKAKQNKVTRKEALRIPGCVREVSLSVRQLVHGISRSCHRSLAPRRGAVQPDGTATQSKAKQPESRDGRSTATNLMSGTVDGPPWMGPHTYSNTGPRPPRPHVDHHVRARAEEERSAKGRATSR